MPLSSSAENPANYKYPVEWLADYALLRTGNKNLFGYAMELVEQAREDVVYLSKEADSDAYRKKYLESFRKNAIRLSEEGGEILEMYAFFPFLATAFIIGCPLPEWSQVREGELGLTNDRMQRDFFKEGVDVSIELVEDRIKIFQQARKVEEEKIMEDVRDVLVSFKGWIDEVISPTPPQERK